MIFSNNEIGEINDEKLIFWVQKSSIFRFLRQTYIVLKMEVGFNLHT